MKKIMRVVLSLFLVVMTMTCFSACAEDTFDLLISVSDVNIKVGDRIKLEYSVNYKDAVITFEIENESVAEISNVGTDFYIVGKTAGETKLVLRARYGKYDNKVSAQIVVSTEESSPEDIKFQFDNFNNITFEDDVFSMSGSMGWFSILPIEDFEINSVSVTCENSVLDITTKKMGDTTIFKFNCTTSGEFVIIVCVNEKNYNYQFNVE